MPKVSRDFRKAYKNQHRILRCKLKMCTNDLIDATRNFMLTFYLEDDSIYIYEDAARNSGMLSGTFLKRGKYKNNLPFDSDSPRYFQPTDIYLGNIISFNGNDMKVVEMDNLSLKFCETYPDEFPFFDSFTICSNIIDHVRSQHIDLRAMFLNEASSNDYVSKDVVVAVLASTGIVDRINDQEALTLIRRIQAENAPDNYFFHELCDIISHFGGLKTAAQRIMAEEKFPSRAVYDLKSLCKLARIRRTQWRRMLRKDSRSLSGLVSFDVVLLMFRKHGFELSSQCVQQLTDAYAVPSIVAHTFFKQIKAVNAKNQASADLNQSGTIRSRGILAATLPAPYQRLGDDRREDTIDNLATSLPGLNTRPSNLSISERREYLLKSSKAGSALSSPTAQDTSSEAMTVVDYTKLCNDIYVCDWI
jgi:hypothetical protein